MDALILRTALALCVPVSHVARMQATDVLAIAVAESRTATERDQMRELRDIGTAFLINAAVWAPESLAKRQDAALARLGRTPAATTSGEAFFAALPLTEPA